MAVQVVSIDRKSSERSWLRTVRARPRSRGRGRRCIPVAFSLYSRKSSAPMRSLSSSASTPSSASSLSTLSFADEEDETKSAQQ